MTKSSLVVFLLVMFVALTGVAHQGMEQIDAEENLPAQQPTASVISSTDTAITLEYNPWCLIDCENYCDDVGEACEEACGTVPRCIMECEWDWYYCTADCARVCEIEP